MKTNSTCVYIFFSVLLRDLKSPESHALFSCLLFDAAKRSVMRLKYSSLCLRVRFGKTAIYTYLVIGL